VPVEWPAVVAPPPLGCEAAGAECDAGAGAECAAGAGALVFFCPLARLGTMIRLRIKSHLATVRLPGWLDFIVLSSKREIRSGHYG